jgi:hypothetical protein
VLSHRSLVRSFLRRPLSLLQMDALEQTLPLKLAACASSAHVPCPGKLRLVPALPYDGSHLPPVQSMRRPLCGRRTPQMPSQTSRWRDGE